MGQETTKVLVVDDDMRLRSLLERYLVEQGFIVRSAGNAEQMDRLIERENFHLLVLDLMLPGEDGLSVCRLVRPHYSGPIIMLTARDDDTDQIVGLEMGADDYLSKPVRPRVLLARISALLRRLKDVQPSQETQLEGDEQNRVTIANLVVDNSMREAWLNEEPIDLTSAEFDLLWLLSSNAGRVLSREEIFTALRGIEYDGQDRSIDVRVSRIRPKIGDDPLQPKRIKTVRSKGYLFVKEL